jgi:hypothetical protein
MDFVFELLSSVTLSGMDGFIVLASQPIVRGYSYQECAVGAEHAGRLGQSLLVVDHGSVVDDIEARHEVERLVRKRDLRNRSLSEPSGVTAVREVEGFGRLIDTYRKSNLAQVLEHTSRAATYVQYGHSSRAWEKSLQKAQTDLPHAHKPPEVILELEELAILFFLHFVCPKADDPPSPTVRRSLGEGGILGVGRKLRRAS